MDTRHSPPRQALDGIRRELLQQLEDWLETPLLVLAGAWLALLVLELVWGLSPLLSTLGTVIWGVFVLEFLVRFLLAPAKLPYLRANWLTVVALLVPALRLFRMLRALRLLRLARATRGLHLVRLLTSLNRGMRALRASMGRRGFGYAIALTTVVALAGAAGMYAFERAVPGARGLPNYGAALWWTAMLMTTMGSDYWPQTAEGRLLCLLLSLYAFAVFGYVTATLATFFIGRDAENDEAEMAGAQAIAQLRAEIAALRAEIRELNKRR